jgi:hypothetical protein
MGKKNKLGSQNTAGGGMGVFSENDLFGLGEWLTARLTDCDHSLQHTTAFLKKRQIPVDEGIEWLGLHGGCCDCEVIMNVCLCPDTWHLTEEDLIGKD